MTNKAFTLIELLVVVLIIGILAVIAVPKYQKAVLKANLHKGIPLVESLYQAQQAYYLANGNFATDLDFLDLKIPSDNSCQKTQTTTTSNYKCDFGKIGMWDDFSNIQFIVSSDIVYLHYLKDRNHRKAGQRWCFAKPDNNTAISVCQSIGGVFDEENENNSWLRYKIN